MQKNNTQNNIKKKREAWTFEAFKCNEKVAAKTTPSNLSTSEGRKEAEKEEASCLCSLDLMTFSVIFKNIEK